jgi:hypothetical protein
MACCRGDDEGSMVEVEEIEASKLRISVAPSEVVFGLILAK